MFPLHQAREIRSAVLQYIKATYPFQEEKVAEAFNKFIADHENGLFKGPYLSLRTPFISASSDEQKDLPLDIAPSFAPYRHQLQAFRQLTTKDGHAPVPTLLTTGTGSGKTECFLYPILDYCYRQNRFGRKQGVKVIILYPMNALATDQAQRLARIIWHDPRLKGKVTAGLFVGEGFSVQDYPRTMGEDNVIEHRNTILDTQPDIVLTNFKMLDYALMRQEFMPLWRGNIDVPQPVLRYVILDELHTYDGAQGTDVANLLRRLKLKLGLSKGQLCPVGTSATIGNGEKSKEQLCAYATNIFGEVFAEENVIEEHRLSIDEYIKVETTDLPAAEDIRTCTMEKCGTVEKYIERICNVWLHNRAATPVEAGQRLRKMGIVHTLLTILEHGPLSVDEILRQLSATAAFRRLRQQDKSLPAIALDNIIALISYAKCQGEDLRETPMLFLQVQLWQRELSGILRYVQHEPAFVWRGDIAPGEERVALPMYFCRDCGASGWISRRLATDSRYNTDVKTIATAFAARDKNVCLLNIASDKHKPADEYVGEDAVAQVQCVSLADLSDAQEGSPNTIRLQVCAKLTNENKKSARTCPECNNRETICQVGGRTATLSSVAISQVLSSDFDSAGDDERKMLVFTNSVQDAAHLAGFYEIRTFRFLFRQSMQKYINTLDKPVNMVELQRGFKEYWHRVLSDEEYYYRFLPADLSTRIDLSRSYRAGKGFIPKFKEEFELRVDWEIASEFGLMSQLGRTLEKTGTSATFFRPELLHEVHEKMAEWMNNNGMAEIAKAEVSFCHFVYGILQRMRTHGAIDHPYFESYREERLSRWNLNWNNNDKHFLNRIFAGDVNFPRLVGMDHRQNAGELLDIAVVRRENRPNWYNVYFSKTFHAEWVLNNVPLFNEFIQHLFAVMVEVGLLNERRQGGGNYALRPEEIWVSKSVQRIKCDHCQSCLSVAKEDQGARSTKCLNYRCAGTYSEDAPNEFNYYQRVYNRARAPRVYAREHTGILDRGEREALEEDFKGHPRANSVNVLAATSTLEMGIDVGDLNVMGNTNIPPTPSNFLQRVGRAGRKEGAALVLNYAHFSEPHDMYYYTYPQEMMQGEINTPGCFLEAREILRRHFFAYCIDSWTTTDKSNTLPHSIRELHLTEGEVFDNNTFVINRIISYINTHKEHLTTAFRSQYEEQSHAAIARLFESVDDHTFTKQIIDEFKVLQRRLIAIDQQLKEYQEIKGQIQPNDPELQRMESLIKATNRQRLRINGENLIEFMTNVGLLPNYAFPETGITLQTSIRRDRAKADNTTNAVRPITFELTRSAAQGIKELAPGNIFYTRKYQLAVNGIPTFDWNNALTSMHYCSCCDGIALEGEEGYTESQCPKCGDTQWGMNIHRVLKFTNAMCRMESNEAAMDDSYDEREKENFITKHHYLFRHSGQTVSYVMRNVCFGIEYCNRMDLYEINYGKPQQSGERTTINEDGAVPYYGFITCRHCGKTTPLLADTEKNTQQQHYKFCKYKTVAFDNDGTNGVFETLYLYRHFQTEAIKILLPVLIGDTETTTQLFKAGIELGMKAYYKSSPEHIRIDTYKEMNLGTTKKDNYLVMYDTIPGGTGYLSKLFNTKVFSEMLKAAYDHIHTCQCQLEEKDGCYHCILTYGNQYNRAEFSRERADEEFEKLVANATAWETISGSVGTILQSGKAEDSVLEDKFVRVLETIARKHEGWHFEKVRTEDTYKYELHIVLAEEETDITYYVVPQFALTAAFDVRHYTVADFLIGCMAAKIGGREVEHLEELPLWAIYLDGYAFHAQAPNVRFYGDKEKRDGIRAAQGEYRLYTWTLTWDDIDLFEQDNSDTLGGNSVERLIELLINPLRANLLETACYKIMDYEVAHGGFLSGGGALFSGQLEVDSSVYDNLTDASTDEEVIAALRNCVRYDWHLTNTRDTIDKDEWLAFWRRYNILQFFDNEEPQSSPAETPSAVEIDRDEVKQYYPGLEDIVDALIDNNVPFSYDGAVELTDEDGTVIATAGMILSVPKKIAIDPDETSIRIFEAKGYTVLPSAEFDINDIIN